MLSQQPLEVPRATKRWCNSCKTGRITNSFEGIGCGLLHRIPNNCTTSDGTTTTTAITPGVYEEGIKSIGSDINSIHIKSGINICYKYVLNILTNLFRQELMNMDAFVYIARNASNGDKTIAALITEAIQEVSIDGLIEIKERLIY